MVRISDTLKQQNDLTSFPVAFGEGIWLNKDKSGATEDYSDLQTMYNNDELGNGGSAIQVDLLPPPSVDELGKIYQFIGSTGTYVNGYFYECVSDGEPTPTYSWVQKNVQPNVNIVDTAIEIDSTWSSKKISADLDNKINKTDITATIDSTSTDTQVPSAKSVYDTTSKFLRTYTSITELGLTVGSETIEDIVNSMEDKTRLITLIFEADNNMSIYPYKNGTLIVEKINIYRVNLKFCEDISSNVYVGTYHGEKGFTGWQELATTDSTLKTIQLSGSVDCNTLTEPGLYTASVGAVISITNTPPNIGSAVQLDGGFSILVTKTNVDSVYYGMQMFIPYGSDVPFIRKSYYLNGQYWTSWQQLATMDKVVPCVENKNPDAKTVSFELNSKSWNCGTIYGNTNNGGNFKYDYYVTEGHIELVKQDGYGQQGSITASLSGTTLTLTADGNTTIKTVTIIKS